MARAASNDLVPMMKRSDPERAMSFCRTIAAISGGVSFMRNSPPQITQAKPGCPLQDVGAIAAGGNEVFHVAQLQIGMRFFCPKKFGQNKVLLTDDPSLEVINFDPLAALEFHQAIGALFADDAIHLDEIGRASCRE